MQLKISLVVLYLAFSGQAISQNWSWAKIYGGSEQDQGQAICVDGSGNIYHTGNYLSSTMQLGSTTLTNAGGMGGPANDLFLVKSDNAGNVIWAKGFGGNSTEWGISMCTDNSNNLYVCGTYGSSSLDFGNGVTLTNGFNTLNYFVVKFNSSGVAQWAKTAIGGGTAEARSMTCDNNGNIYVVGIFGPFHIGFNGSTDTLDFNNSSANNSFLVKYSNNGTYQYSKRILGYTIGSSGLGGVKDICLDNSDNIYITGTGTEIGNPLYETEIYLAKYSNSGIIQWQKHFGGNKPDYANAIVCDGSGNVFITGEFTSTSISFGSNSITNGSATNERNRYLAKFDNSGNSVWAKGLSKITAFSNDLAIDGNGNLYVAGSVKDTTIFMQNAGIFDAVIYKLNNNGQIQWIASAGDGFTGGQLDMANGVALDNSGNIYVTGMVMSDPAVFGGNSINTNGIGDDFIAKLTGAGVDRGGWLVSD